MPAKSVDHHQRSPVASAWLSFISAGIISGAVALLITWTVLPGEQPVVAAGAAMLATAVALAAAMAAYQAGQIRLARAAAQARKGELATLVDDVLPAAATRLRDEAATPDTILADAAWVTNGVSERLVRLFVAEIGISERRRAAAMAACAAAVGRIQALTTTMSAELREMEDRHDGAVLADLLKIDHHTAQAGRLADGIATLTGAHSGRRWTRTIKMESILRGALSRIEAYQRVRLHSTSTAEIAGYAAEAVINVLAELIDNGTKFSAWEDVHVGVEEPHTGVVVTIEDGGLGMKPQVLAKAEAAVSPTKPLDLASLSGTRLGLAVVGELARKYQLTVRFRTSSFGGVGVIVQIPNHLISWPQQEPTEEPTAQRPVRPPEQSAVTVSPSGRAPAPADGSVPRPAAAGRPELPRRTPSNQPGPSAPAPHAAAADPVAPASRPAQSTAQSTLPANRTGPAITPLPVRTPGGTLNRRAPRPEQRPVHARQPSAPPKTGEVFAAFWESVQSPDNDAPENDAPENDAPENEST